jgi:hypothetical protein
MGRSPQCVAYHEAGHAIIALSEGYKVISIELWSDSAGKWQGITNYSPQTFNCKECRLRAESRHNPQDLRILNDECPSCLAEKRRFGRRLLAGGSATKLLHPAEHNEDDSGDDRTQLGALYPCRSSARETAFAEGRVQADSAVSQLACTIRKLKQLILVRLGSSDRVFVYGADIEAVFNGGVPPV